MRLRHIVSVGPSARETKHRHPDTEVTFAPMEALADGLGGLDTSTVRQLSDVTAGSYNFFSDGDLLLAKVTPCFENGKKALAKDLTNGIGYATSEVHVIRPRSDAVDPRYLLYTLSSEPFRAEGMKSMTGAGGLRRVSENAILNFKLPVDDLPTQKTIAAFLDRETARIDQLIEKKQRLVELLGERKFAKTTEVLTGATTPAAVRRKAGPEWMPLVPNGWKWVRMKDICTRIIDCKNRTPPSVDSSDYFVVRTTCVRNGSFNTSGGYWTDRTSYLEWTQRGKPMAGDVVFTREAPVGEACLAPTDLQFCLGQRTMIYRPDRSKVMPEYIIATIYSSIGRDYIQSKSKGSTVGHLRVGEVYDFPCLLPPLEQQDELLREIRHASGDVDQMTALTKTSIDRLKEYRSALITAAVTGQIDVETWSSRGEGDRRLDQIEEEMAG